MSGDAPLITSATNPLLTRIRKLSTKKGRAQSGHAFIEGIAVVRQAIAADVDIDTVIVAPDLLRSDEGRAAVDEAARNGATVRNLDPGLFRKISDRDNPAGLAAIVAPQSSQLDEIQVGGNALVVMLDAVSNPGNLGSIARTADAIGAPGIVLTGDSTDPWDPAAIKASMGTLFELPVCEVHDARTAIVWARSKGLETIATSARAQLSIYEADLSLPALVMFGSERHGLDDDTIAMADERVRIPITGHASSLNLAVAAGISLFEIARRFA